MRFVSTESLFSGMILGRDIISPMHSIILKRGIELNKEHIAYLTKNGYLGAYIMSPDTEDIEPEEYISQNTLKDSINAVCSGDIGELMSASRKIVGDLSSMNQLSIDLFDLRSFDEYTFRHSVNVAVYATAVAKYLEMNEKELYQMAQAGICHDLGKRMIPSSIINKPGRLNDLEFAEVKKHPQYSYDILSRNHEISSVVRQAVLYHHENENGSGYPSGKTGAELSDMVKILHAVDIYDALISRRPYKNPYTPAEAYEYMMGGRGILFDVRIVDAMKMVIPAYPIATDVKLSTGEEGVVVAHTNNPIRPIIRIFGENYDIDLTKREYRNITITPIKENNNGLPEKVEKLNEGRSAVKNTRPKVLIVDDSIVSLRQTTAALANEDYDLITLQSGMASVNYIRKNGAVDLVIMDVEMPNVSGIGAVSTFREMGYSDMPVIFLTANHYKETVQKCIEVRAKDYIVKPVIPLYLRERVAIALGVSWDR